VPDTTQQAENSAPTQSKSPFEFGEDENRLFSQLALRMQIVGLAILVWAFFQSPRVFSGDVGALAFTLAMAVTGILTIMAANQFRAITRTEGSDIAHLMRALWSVHSLYTLAASIIGVIVVWIVIGLGFTLMVTLG